MSASPASSDGGGAESIRVFIRLRPEQKNEVRRALQAEDARRRAAEADALLDAAGGDGQR